MTAHSNNGGTLTGWNGTSGMYSNGLLGGGAMSPTIVAPMAGIVRPVVNVGNWKPMSNEYQIWIAPAGWAEAAYLNGEKIDGEDPLSFLDRLEGVEEVSVRCEQKMQEILISGYIIAQIPGKPAVTVTFGREVIVDDRDKYNELFPVGESRDIVLQASKPIVERSGRERLKTARCVIANVVMVAREFSISTHGVSYESITFAGDGYFPLVEQK